MISSTGVSKNRVSIGKQESLNRYLSRIKDNLDGLFVRALDSVARSDVGADVDPGCIFELLKADKIDDLVCIGSVLCVGIDSPCEGDAYEEAKARNREHALNLFHRKTLAQRMLATKFLAKMAVIEVVG